MKLKNLKFMWIFAVLLCISWCTTQQTNVDENYWNDVNNTLETINESDDETKQELLFPTVNRWKTEDYQQWWNTLVMEIENENKNAIDIEFNIEYFDVDWNSLGSSEGLYYYALKPNETWLIRYSWEIPSAADIKITPTFIWETTFNDVNYQITRNEKIGNTVDVDFDIDWELTNANVYVLFYNWNKIMSVESYTFFDKNESAHIFESIGNFDHYEVYANIY